MNKYLLIIVFFLSLNSCNRISDENQIQMVYNDYKQALISGNSDLALKSVSEETINYFENLVEPIKIGDSLEITNLSFYDQVVILTTRASKSSKSFEDLTGGKLFKMLIEDKFIDKESVYNSELGEILVSNEKYAQAYIVTNNEQTNFVYDFYKEDGKWKIDISSIFWLVDVVMEEQIKEEGLDKVEYLVKSIEIFTGEKIDSTIWNR